MGREALRTYEWEDSTYWKYNNPVLFSYFESRGRLMRRKNVISWVNTEKMSVVSRLSPLGSFLHLFPSHYCHAPQSKRVLAFFHL